MNCLKCLEYKLRRQLQYQLHPSKSHRSEKEYYKDNFHLFLNCDQCANLVNKKKPLLQLFKKEIVFKFTNLNSSKWEGFSLLPFVLRQICLPSCKFLDHKRLENQLFWFLARISGTSACNQKIFVQFLPLWFSWQKSHLHKPTYKTLLFKSRIVWYNLLCYHFDVPVFWNCHHNGR